MDFLTYNFAFAIIFFIFLYYHFTKNLNYWQKRNFPCAKNVLPFFGNSLSVFLLRENIGGLCKSIYKSNPKLSMVGFYHYNHPCLLVRDPELVKKVLITNFTSFSENDVVISEEDEPMLSKNPFFSSGATWKESRNRLTSNFTSGKLKVMSQMISGVMKKLTNFVDEKIEKSGQFYEIDAKLLFSRVTAEVVSSVGFGIEGYCFEDKEKSNSFNAFSQLVFGSGWISKIKLVILFQFPWLLILFRIRFIPTEFQNFFKQLVEMTLTKQIQKTSEVKHFVHMIIEQEEKDGSDNPAIRTNDITSHMLSFFVDVYETSSIVMTFVCYQLAVEKSVQRKAREEVLAAISKTNGELNFETINEMIYLDQVIYETMRFFPAIGAQVKKCTQEIELCGSDGLKVTVEPEMRVYIPLSGLHKDELYWPNPEKFDPDRFEKERVNERHKTVYLPFGEGPRMCPGRKMANMVLKMTMAAMLTKYEFELSPRTKLPLKIDPILILPYVSGGMWVRFKPLK